MQAPTKAGSGPGMHLIYLDEAKTHEVHAEVNVEGATMSLVTTEFPAGSADPLEAVSMEERLPSPQQVVARLADLEARLLATGAYWRADAADMAWRKVDGKGRPALDLRAHEFDLPDKSGRIKFHHFHGADADKLFVSLPREDMAGRFVLADLQFEFPRIDDAEVNILHARLAPTLLTSSIAREHIDLPRRGFSKLLEPAQYQQAFGDGWQRAASVTFSRAAQLILGRRPAGELMKDAPRDDTRLTPELQRALASRGVQDARRRFLAPGDEEELLSGGEFHIRRYINGRRRRADHRDQWGLSILEAALLVEWGVRVGRQHIIDEQAGKLVRYAQG